MINSFLLIGQSNMAGRGELSEVEPIENKEVLVFKNGEWVTAKEPLHPDNPSLAGIGLGMSFADTLQKKSQKSIGLIPCAVGGSSLDQWKKDEPLYIHTIHETRAAMENSQLKGILWHQGESDADHSDTAETYKDRFLHFALALQGDLGISNTPIILGELGGFLEQYDACIYHSLVNEALRDIAHEHITFSFVRSIGLNHTGDFLHYNSPSLRELGFRYANAWENLSQIIGISLN